MWLQRMGRRSKQRAAAATWGMHLWKLFPDSLPLTQASSLRLREKTKPVQGSAMPCKLSIPYLLPSLAPSLCFGIPRQRQMSVWQRVRPQALLCSIPGTLSMLPLPPWPGFRGKKSFPESRLGMSQQWISFLQDPFQSVSTRKGIKQRAKSTQPQLVLATNWINADEQKVLWSRTQIWVPFQVLTKHTCMFGCASASHL